MEDWEDAILERQESEADECKTCPYKGDKCRNQCMETKNIYNPNLKNNGLYWEENKCDYIERQINGEEKIL